MAADIQSQVEVLRSWRQKNVRQTTALSEVLDGLSESLIDAYRLTAQKARKAQSPDEEAAIWQEMSDACNSALAEMKKLGDLLPATASGSSYDKILDLKLAAEERKNWVLEEKACQSKTPKGLFPVKS